MSVETITTIISAAALMLSFAAAFGWMINRTDKQFADMRSELAGVERELVEVKIAIARIEGPPRHLASAR